MSGTTIAILAHAKDAEDAKSEAQGTAENLFDLHAFDYGELTENEPVLYYSKEGQRIVKERLEWQKEFFCENAEKLRRCFRAHTNEELFDSLGDQVPVPAKETKGTGPTLDTFLFRYIANTLGQFRGDSLWIYDRHGNGIYNESVLSPALKIEPYKAEEASGYKVWVVLYSVHF